jgi:dihydroorotase
MYDLIIKGGRVIDPAQNIDGVMDVAVEGGKIAKVTPDIPNKEAKRVRNAAGKIVTPGLIDVHTHVYDGVIENGVSPDDLGVKQGVTTVVDCGSAGWATFGGFPKYVIPSAKTTVYCLLHIGSFGLSSTPELWYPEEINPAAFEACVVANPGLIRGVKIRVVGKLIASRGAEIVKIAKDTAKKVGLPLMVHIGDPNNWVPATVTKDLLPLLEKGDILTHIYSGLQGGVLQANGKVLPEFDEARKRGVLFDVAHGRNNYNYSVARRMIVMGYLPNTLSTDTVRASLPGPVYGLMVTMSKFIALGIPFEKEIAMVTINSARTVHIDDRKGSLKPGMDADISVLELKSGKWRILDFNNEVLNMDKMVTPFLTVKAGELITPKPVSWPEEVK